MRKIVISAVLAATLVAPIMASATETVDKVLITLTSAEQQTRGMAMVLGNMMQAKGAKVSVLLCDSAGDMALKEYKSEPLKPKNVTPEQLLQKLISGGAKVDVCALYLPNKGVGMEALLDGVGAAKPPVMADALMDSDTRVFNF
ncbi:Predicted peroxiredoxin [Amphritea atlantica]|uniref:Predicted peroxiredoxin n=1 Tax=Amphritea atlantica TaxID=355243 RepID=A0A1H9D9W6_9GAMM|nr:DsrE family protein [Amphritea atlantica]SEQ10254.1 Predicted peroxiredoxin [Amphritea atlantica]